MSFRTLGVLAAVTSLLAMAGCGSPAAPAGDPAEAHPAASSRSSAAVPGSPTESVPTRPNIVFVLVDDLSMNLVQYMPNVQRMQRDGTTFTNYTVTDSLCCPSRASILKGQFPHNTGIVKNHGSDGGFRLFHSRGQEKSTIATDLQAAGYRTAFLGKYLNEYFPKKTMGTGKPYVPPGWDQWFGGGNAYDNFDYDLNENGQVKRYGKKPQDYLTDVIAGKAANFISTTAATGQPFMVEVSTYTPHSPYTPAPRDEKLFPGLKAPRTAAYDKVPAGSAWLPPNLKLTKDQARRVDEEFRKRVQSVQSVDRMIGTLRDTLAKSGVSDDTVVIFSSDNGYHMGEYALPSGKQTAFDTDVNVPLIVAGHGVGAGRSVSSVVANIDLRPTFTDLAGAPPSPECDGRSFKALLSGEAPADWRHATLIEHHDPATDPKDPDFQYDSKNIPPSYDAMRTERFTYIEYVDGTREYFDRKTDPYMLTNIVGTLAPERLAELSTALHGLATCVGADACGKVSRAVS
ncbi:arylsulfatase A-like enzyme [Actinoplanes campanulatus]|uniref:Arylsulfatase A-like enzyme n=1 Tax=Actinoplanes campanulatus TaxID=113559 RepID=A0A7W5AMC6_9ACTN|nr:sulfatase [Actinoplanes campanulatus]MBB3098775.1 arylsulfatase A-like enzyme [Actinoplanes campanulatus]GGN37099.1 sulfatase [Actinoplanes campanulatus]GID40723.1 sulfatase [Actinoplanes campanulatus]